MSLYITSRSTSSSLVGWNAGPGLGDGDTSLFEQMEHGASLVDLVGELLHPSLAFVGVNLGLHVDGLERSWDSRSLLERTSEVESTADLELDLVEREAQLLRNGSPDEAFASYQRPEDVLEGCGTLVSASSLDGLVEEDLVT